MMDTSKPTEATETKHTPPPPENRRPTAVAALLAVCIAAVIVPITFPGRCSLDQLLTSPSRESARRTQALQQVAYIANAIKLYETQYGALPPIGNSDRQDIPTGAPLIDILTGHSREQNPKEIIFIEGKSATGRAGKRPARGGLIDLGGGSQSLVDPWGNPYFVRLDSDGDGVIPDPSTGIVIRGRVIAWSYGKPDGRSKPVSAMQNDPQEWLTSWR